MFYRFLLGKVKPELVLQLLVNIAMLDILDVRVDHKRDEVKYQIRRLPQNGKGGEAEGLETRIMGRGGSAHPFHHLLTELDRRREGLRIATKDVTKVNMEEVTVRRKEQIVKVPVAYTHDVSNDAISS